MTRTQYSVRSAWRDRLVADDDLDDARRVPQVEEGDAAVIAAPGDPAGEGDGGAGVGGAQVPA